MPTGVMKLPHDYDVAARAARAALIASSALARWAACRSFGINSSCASDADRSNDARTVHLLRSCPKAKGEGLAGEKRMNELRTDRALARRRVLRSAGNGVEEQSRSPRRCVRGPWLRTHRPSLQTSALEVL
jgi:hypothetical protein